ncbi:NAD(P)-binding domain-containing protein [Anaerovorax odorimutans]|uniref:NAD(P)-binding domain-containing protein n=1 Tax=Anaerovorax odorimutans TaxID=109327 RepID=A0ABT1RPB2_9FIRM|nr:NAD(P)-binding domain-containing protein [Anaerovorax odorimutans]MCQ4637039.1 NAD(P)-binding domain-containing protein [Anaerovorax odorimutans]
MKKIGFIGLGIMGRPMALNLLRAGADVLVNDADNNVLRMAKEQGIHTGTISAVGRECDLVFMILPNGDIVKEVIFGEGGLTSSIKKPQVICDMSSVTPAESQYCHKRLEQMGIGFADAPVSGGEPKAIDGTLSFMVGGDEQSYQLLKPYFEIMGSSSVLIGGSGSGSIAKLANQIIVNLSIAAVSEAFVLVKKAGADPRKVYEAIRGGLAGSEVLDAKLPMILKRDFTPGGKIAINHKDIKNVLETAKDQKIPLPFTAQLFQVMQALDVSGNMEDDHCGIIQYFERLAGVEVG